MRPTPASALRLSNARLKTITRPAAAEETTICVWQKALKTSDAHGSKGSSFQAPYSRICHRVAVLSVLDTQQINVASAPNQTSTVRVEDSGKDRPAQRQVAPPGTLPGCYVETAAKEKPWALGASARPRVEKLRCLFQTLQFPGRRWSLEKMLAGNTPMQQRDVLARSTTA